MSLYMRAFMFFSKQNAFKQALRCVESIPVAHHLAAILTEALLDQIICAAAAAHGLPSEASLSLH